MILVVTKQNTILFEIKKHFPGWMDWQQIDFSELPDELTKLNPDLIFVDLTENEPGFADRVADQLIGNQSASNCPLIAIIDHPDQRPVAQQIRAIDYVFYPLAPEIDIRKIRNIVNYQLNQKPLLEEIQSSLAQDTFAGLIARMIGDELDIQTIVSLALGQTIRFLDATAGAIWLVSADRQQLSLAASITSGSMFAPTRLIPSGKGVIGWAAAQNKPIDYLGVETMTDARLDEELDGYLAKNQQPALIIPISYHRENIGVMMICGTEGRRFTHQEVILSTSIASLTASAIVNARLVDEMRESTLQLRALYEMSQQVAASLDLQTTIKRSLQWIGRLCETEAGFFWSLNADQNTASPVVSIGVAISADEQMVYEISQDPFARAAHSLQALNCDHLQQDSNFCSAICQHFQIHVRNLMVIPIVNLRQISGFITLINKIGGNFTEGDQLLLSTAAEMIGVTIGNANMHAKLLRLMDEREELTQQALYKERLATVGRLTASLSHEINNPLQAIKGALTLALEDLHEIDEVDTFIRLSLNETKRIVQLINRMRQIYRPHQDEPISLNLVELLQDVVGIGFKEFQRQDIRFDYHLPDERILVWGVGNQLHLAFLSILLNFSDSIGDLGGGNLQLDIQQSGGSGLISIATNTPISQKAHWLQAFERKSPDTENELSFGSSLSCDIITSHAGSVELHHLRPGINLTIQFPIHNQA